MKFYAVTIASQMITGRKQHERKVEMYSEVFRVHEKFNTSSGEARRIIRRMLLEPRLKRNQSKGKNKGEFIRVRTYELQSITEIKEKDVKLLNVENIDEMDIHDLTQLAVDHGVEYNTSKHPSIFDARTALKNLLPKDQKEVVVSSNDEDDEEIEEVNLDSSTEENSEFDQEV